MSKLVPEFLVSDLGASLKFWCDLLGFKIKYDRPEERFAYLDCDGAELMLEQHSKAERQWIAAEMHKPFGRGINFQIEVASVDVILNRLAKASWPLFMDVEEKWYRIEDKLVGQKQFLVQDPDGYLLRLCQDIGERHAA
jgi:catechol 2,3-dioxygenase-like lactoylglutathione lyase family enzyme